MNQVTEKSSGSPNLRGQASGGESAGIVSEFQGISACPECGSIALEFGSRDPCEGDYWWCQNCSCGPILFPLGHVETIGTVVRRQAEIQRIRKAQSPSVIDAEENNREIVFSGAYHPKAVRL